MRRRDVSPEKLPRIIALKQGNTSWLKIQRETGIPRRIAKRAYEQWQHSQAREELKEARKDIAAEEFRRHMDALNHMADSLIGILCIPSTPAQASKAEDLLASLWQQDMSWTGQSTSLSKEPSDRDVRRIERQNRMVFKSLQDHTQGKVRWEALEDWKQSWNNSISLMSKLKKQAREVMDGYLKQKPGLNERVEKATNRVDVVEQMVGVVLEVVWRGGAEGEAQEKPVLFQVKEQPGNVVLVVGPNGHPVLMLKFGEKKLAEEAAAVCNLAAQNLLTTQSEIIKKIEQELAFMGKRIEELEEMLDPLRLRPLILSSRCELCPA